VADADADQDDDEVDDAVEAMDESVMSVPPPRKVRLTLMCEIFMVRNSGCRRIIENRSALFAI
jgi:hypothetical protein